MRRCEGFLSGLRALLPRSDLPGAKQPTPFGVNRYILLLCYSLYGFFTAAVFFCWPAMAAVIMRNEGFSNLCPKDPLTGAFIRDLRREQKKLYICDEQDAAIQKLFPLTGACCCAMSACGGALLDWIGPRWTACFGQTLTIIGWLLLAFGGSNSTPYIAGMAFIGLGADAGFLPAMCVTRVFPGASGFVITILGSASTASSAVPLILRRLIETHGITLKQAALGYIGVGPCFAILVATLLLPKNNFLVDTDTPPPQTPVTTSTTTLDKTIKDTRKEEDTGSNSNRRSSNRMPGMNENSVAGTGDKGRSSVRGFACPNVRKIFFRQKPYSLPLVVVVDTGTGHLDKGNAGSTSGTCRTESTATEGGEISIPDKRGGAEWRQQQTPQGVVAAAATVVGEGEGEGDDEGEEPSPKTEIRRPGEKTVSWVMGVELSGAEESTTAGSAGCCEREVEGVESEGNKRGRKGRGEGTKIERKEQEEEEARRGRESLLLGRNEIQDHQKRKDDVNEPTDGDTEKESKKVGFLSQALSIRYVTIVLYFVGVSWAGAFFQQAPRRMFSDNVVWIMELLQPFGSIPCIILGRLADICGILKILTLINTFGLLMYACSLGRTDVSGYVSVICFTLYISLFTSQVFIYIEKTFSPVYFGKLIGIAVLIGGLLSFVCNPLYETVVVKTNNGDPFPVQVAMVVLMCFQYVWIAILTYLKWVNPRPYHRGGHALNNNTTTTATITPTLAVGTADNNTTPIVLPMDDAFSSSCSSQIQKREVTHATVSV